MYGGATHHIFSFSVSDQYSAPGLYGKNEGPLFWVMAVVSDVRVCGPTSVSTFASCLMLPRALCVACPFPTPLQARLSHCTSPAEIRMPIRDIFDEAQQMIYHLIDTDAFPRFMLSIHAQMQVRYVLEQVPSCCFNGLR